MDSSQRKLGQVDYLASYLQHLRVVKRRAENTVLAYQSDLQQFFLWLDQEQLSCVSVNSQQVTQYLIWRMSQGAKSSTSNRAVSSLKGFYKHQVQTGAMVVNPCLGIKSPKRALGQQMALTVEQVDQLLAAPDLTLLIGIRDKAMLELLYATGITVSELISLECQDINLARKQLVVPDKTGSGRVVPLIDAAIKYLNKYLDSSRSQWLAGDIQVLFLSRRGAAMTRQAFWYRVSYYAQIAGLPDVSARQLRKAFAVHLLSNGVSGEQMQELMGHQTRLSTDSYLQLVSLSK